MSTREEEDNIEVEFNEDLPAGTPVPPGDDDELEEDPEPESEARAYKPKVKKGREARIEELTHHRREAERQAEEALKYARGVMEENKRLKSTLTAGDKLLQDQAKGRIELDMAAAEREYKEAYELGDAEKMAKSNRRIAKLQNEQDRVESYQPVQFAEPAPPPQANTIDQKALDWRANNSWFEKDDEMTALAFGLHAKLIKEGVDGRSDEYYKKLDEGIRRRFPDKFGDEEPRSRADGGSATSANRPATVVASASRTPGNRRKVQLTPSQVSIANKLGVPLDEYARQLVKEQR